MKERSPGLADALRGLHERDPRLPADRQRVPVRRLRGGLRLQDVGLPSLFDPSVEEIIVSAGVRLAERLFPTRSPGTESQGWTARGDLPELETPALRPPVAEPDGGARHEPRAPRCDRRRLLGVVQLPAVLPRRSRSRHRRCVLLLDRYRIAGFVSRGASTLVMGSPSSAVETCRYTSIVGSTT